MGLDWRLIDTCIIDMDGTILDLHYDHQVWHVELPRRLAKRNNQTFFEAKAIIEEITNAKKGSLIWYDLDYWKAQICIDLDEIEIALSHLIKVRSGALQFLQAIRKKSTKVFLATNAHPRGLDRKLRRTGISPFFDQIVSSHDFGSPKEDIGFWKILNNKHPFEKNTTLLLDDNLSVLETASEFGLKHAYGILRPNSRGKIFTSDRFELIDDYSSLL